MGKNKVVAYHPQVPYRVLERIPEKSVLDSHGSDCGNMVIHGQSRSAQGPAARIRRQSGLHLHRSSIQHRQRGRAQRRGSHVRGMSDTVHHHGGGVERGLGLPVRLCPGNRREVVHELCGHLYFLLYDVVRVVIFNGSDGKHGLVLAAVDSSAPRQKLFDHLFGKGRTVMDSGG